MITFPIRTIDTLVSLVTLLSVLILTKFVVIQVCTCIHRETSYFTENTLIKNDLQYCFLSICAMM